VLGHTLNLVVIQAGAAQRVFEASPDKALDAVKSIETTSRQALSDVDRMLGILRDPDEKANPKPSLEARPSISRLDTLVAELNATGQPIEYTVSGNVTPLVPSTDLTAYRVVQEALTNVMTHAAGSNAQVEVKYGDTQLEVVVKNDASGTDTLAGRKSGGRGIVGMRERTTLFGGNFEAGRTDDGGWSVRATFPINRTNTVGETGESEDAE
jgi:signal transduction histidine kinase